MINDVASVIVAYYTTPDVVGSRHQLELVERTVDDLCTGLLSEWMRPMLVHVDSLPLQPHTGKVDRQALKAIYLDELRKQCNSNLDTLNDDKKKVSIGYMAAV